MFNIFFILIEVLGYFCCYLDLPYVSFQNFCTKDLDLFSQFLFYKMLELADWDLKGNQTFSEVKYSHIEIQL